MRPHRRVLVGPSLLSLLTISALHVSWASVSMRPNSAGSARASRPNQPLSTGVAERGERALTPGFRFFEQREERRLAAQRIELRTRRERRGHEGPPRDRAH